MKIGGRGRLCLADRRVHLREQHVVERAVIHLARQWPGDVFLRARSRWRLTVMRGRPTRGADLSVAEAFSKPKPQDLPLRMVVRGRDIVIFSLDVCCSLPRDGVVPELPHASAVKPPSGGGPFAAKQVGHLERSDYPLTQVGPTPGLRWAGELPYDCDQRPRLATCAATGPSVPAWDAALPPRVPRADAAAVDDAASLLNVGSAQHVVVPA